MLVKRGVAALAALQQTESTTFSCGTRQILAWNALLINIEKYLENHEPWHLPAVCSLINYSIPNFDPKIL